MPIPQPGRSAERVGFFTDAVVAIAMTLLVVEIPRPEGPEFAVGGGVGKAEAASSLWHFLATQSHAFFAYLLAVVMLWSVWRQHHTLVDSIEWLSTSAVRWHLPLLLLVGFLPYPTAVMGHYPNNPLALGLFGVTYACLLLSRAMLLSRAYRQDALKPGVALAHARHQVAIAWVTTGYWSLTLLLVWWPSWIRVAWILVWLIRPVGELLRRQVEPRTG